MTTVALIGNPNAGKTTVFNALTGSHQRVGNWPGVTVERKSGHFRHGDARLEVIDLPGIYSLLAVNATDAQDARIARDFLLDAEIDVIVNVVDAASLARGLYLTAELLDLDIPVIVALNMMDVADRHGMHIDPYKLGDSIGAPVVPLVASRNEGIGTLKDVIESAAGNATALNSGAQTRHRADARARDHARDRLARVGRSGRRAPPTLRGGGAARRRRGRRGANRSGRSTRVGARVRGNVEHRTLSRHRRAVGAGAAPHGGSPHRHRHARCGVSESCARVPAVPRRDVSDVHVHHQHRQRVHRLLRSVRHGAVRRRTAPDLCIARPAGVVEHVPRRRHRRRRAAGVDVHPGDRVSVPVPLVPRRLRLHGSRRVHRRPADAPRRFTRQIVRTVDRRFRLQRARRDGHAHARQRTRSRADHIDGAVHVVRCAPDRVCAVRGGVLSDQRAEPGVRAVSVRHRRCGDVGADRAPLSAAARVVDVRDGATGLSHADVARPVHAHLAAPQGLRPARRQSDRRRWSSC